MALQALCINSKLLQECTTSVIFVLFAYLQKYPAV